MAIICPLSSMYTFILTLTKEQSTLALHKEGVLVSEQSWPEARDMGERLFRAIDTLLKEEKLEPRAVSDLVIESELPEMYTSMRIAETVKKVYTFGVVEMEGKK